MRRREAVFRNAGRICERCERAVTEEVHHKNGDRTNNEFSNLMALCHDCHMALDQKKRAADRREPQSRE
jgi:HNH endonuclease